MEIRGIIPPIITAFDQKGSLCEEAQREVVAFLSKHVHGFYVCGTYGSGPLMNSEERKRTLEIVIDETPENIFVIAHIGAADTRTSLELGQHAQEVGADAIASVPPFYYKHREEEVKDHFRILNEQVDLQIYFYNNPKTTGFYLTPQFLAELVDEELVSGIKDSSFDILTFYDFVRKVKKEGFNFVIGTEALLLPAFLAGAKASVAGLANAIPEDPVKLYEALVEGDLSKAWSLHERVLSLRDIVHFGPSIPTVHAILKERGINSGHPRAPFKEIDEKTLQEVKESLTKLGIGPI